MEAHLARAVPRTALLLGLNLITGIAISTEAAGYRTKNFTVSAPTPALAKEIGDAAERYRHQLAIEWLGTEMPPWSKPCPIYAQVSPGLGAGGATSFVFDRGEVFNWSMKIQGSRERILDSVLPHEITHTIFASHFRQPVPRWADEGACTTVENPSEIAKQERNLVTFLKTGRGIPFSQMFAMREYPPDVMPLYAQGHSLASWLIESRGRKAFIEFLADGMSDENWQRAVHRHYGFESLLAMQTAWNEWVRQGRPRLTPETSPIVALASNNRTPSGGSSLENHAIYRGQSPDDIRPISAENRPATKDRAAVTLGSGTESVYAAAAERAEHMRLKASPNRVSTATDSADSAAPASVYDASHQTGTLLR